MDPPRGPCLSTPTAATGPLQPTRTLPARPSFSLFPSLSQAKADRAAARSDAAANAKAEADRVDMTMEDPEEEAIRQRRMAALKAASQAKKNNFADGHGELHEIVEEDFLKEVTGSR